jgi:hypothetical protein
METRYCSRCKKHMELKWFQDPVAICLVCYSFEPYNRAIANNLAELKFKAANSVNAKARRRREGARNEKAARMEGLSTQQQRVTRDIVTAPDDEFEMVRCGECDNDIAKALMKFHKDNECHNEEWRRAQLELPKSDAEEEAEYNRLMEEQQLGKVPGKSKTFDYRDILGIASGRKKERDDV